MKVLQIYKDYYPPVKGGIEKHVYYLANGLKQCGVEVEVLVSNHVQKLAVEYNNDIRIIKAPQFGRIASAPINPTFPHLLMKLARDADVLHFHLPNPTAVISYLLSGIQKPVVVTYHSDIVRQKILKQFYTPFSQWFLKKADAIIATSPVYVRVSDELIHYRKKCRVIPLGTQIAGNHSNNGTSLCPDLIRRQLKSQLILFVGKFRYYKGIDCLVSAMQSIDAILMLVGSGPLDKDLRKYVNQLGLEKKVIFWGEVPENEISSYFEASDLVVLPSTFKSEAFGMVLLEAMSFGKPVVSTELGTGTSFVNVHNKTGLVVPPGDTAALAEAINKILKDDVLRRKFGKAGKERVSHHFDVRQMVKRVLGVYSEVLN